ncbi:MAG: DUF5667 domain-containing protein [bacterium]
MTEKEIIKQLKNLQQIKAEAGWQANNRQVLLQQVFNGQTEQALAWTAQLNLIMSRVLQPTAIALMIFVFLLGGSLISWHSGAAQPGDSLYIAKRLGEKTKLTVALSDQAKTKLNLQFATERAKELAQVLDQAEDNPAKEEAVASLKQEFKQQVTAAKARLAKAEPNKAEADQVELTEEEVEFFQAGTNKDGQGVDIALPAKQNLAEATAEAEELIAQEDLVKAAEKLAEVEEMINQAEQLPSVPLTPTE